MDRDEFRTYLVSLGAFYDVAHAKLEPGPAAAYQHRKFLHDIELAKTTRAMAEVTLNAQPPTMLAIAPHAEEFK